MLSGSGLFVLNAERSLSSCLHSPVTGDGLSLAGAVRSTQGTFDEDLACAQSMSEVQYEVQHVTTTFPQITLSLHFIDNVILLLNCQCIVTK